MLQLNKILRGVGKGQLILGATMILLIYSFNIASAQFSDTKNSSLNYLYEQGMVRGYSDGTFKPANTINRAELLTLILKGKKVEVQKFTENCFSDVDIKEWYGPYICTAKANGWISGYSDGTFKPAQFINKAEALKIIAEVYDWKLQKEEDLKSSFIDVQTAEWFAKYINTALNQNFIDKSEYFYPGNLITRGEVAEILYRTVNTNSISQIKTGTSFGMCLGYCYKEWTITPTEIIFTKKGRDIGDGTTTQELAEVTEKINFTVEEWKELIATLNLEKFNTLPDTLGCPDCADGGAEWVEVSQGNNVAPKKVMFDNNQSVPEIDAFLEKLRSLRGKMDSQNW